uniref:AlNc14C4G606 protein n=1 Tax=Albugo laibachii Nc14 TaxID=890382 RepID=F0W0G4_9STRA|nr:AlNc14C4G606 [Albugo laibachii Nc14]|eukprot:CCA14536.1 AlNc14C4G606 [Albugo laibachii Nc14]
MTASKMLKKSKKHRGVNSTVYGTPPSQRDSQASRRRNSEVDQYGEIDCGTPIKLHLRSNKKRKRSEKNTNLIKISLENDEKMLGKQSVIDLSSVTADAKRDKVICLSDWCIQWPPLFKKDPETKLVVESSVYMMIDGFMLGKKLSLLVVRRISMNNVVVISRSSESDRVDAFSVELRGCLDIEKAKERKIPVKIMELMVEGFPTHWKKRLSKLLKQSKSLKQDQETENDSLFLKKYAQKMCKKARNSGRKKELNPLMDWWRGDKPEGNCVMERMDDIFSPSTQSPSERQKILAGSKKAKCVKSNSTMELKNSRPSETIKDWTESQLEALEIAKISIPPNDTNFWEQVAKLVPGKTSSECRSKSFEQISSPFRRKGSTSTTRTSFLNEDNIEFPGAQKMHRLGSNLWKKQVRGFVKKYEAQNADDIFEETPMKHAVRALHLDTQQFKTPETLASTLGMSQGGKNTKWHENLDQKLDFDDSDSDAQPLNHGREVLGDLDSLRRDEVDSYVLAVKRRLGHKRNPKRNTFAPKGNCQRVKSTVSITQNCGKRVMEGTISPGGTASIQFMDEDSSSEELDKEDFSESDED